MFALHSPLKYFDAVGSFSFKHEFVKVEDEIKFKNVYKVQLKFNYDQTNKCALKLI